MRGVWGVCGVYGWCMFVRVWEEHEGYVLYLSLLTSFSSWARRRCWGSWAMFSLLNAVPLPPSCEGSIAGVGVFCSYESSQTPINILSTFTHTHNEDNTYWSKMSTSGNWWTYKQALFSQYHQMPTKTVQLSTVHRKGVTGIAAEETSHILDNSERLVKCFDKLSALGSGPIQPWNTSDLNWCSWIMLPFFDQANWSIQCNNSLQHFTYHRLHQVHNTDTLCRWWLLTCQQVLGRYCTAP